MRSSKGSVTLAASLLALAILAGCSSAPSVPEETLTRRNQAARFSESGNAQFNAGNYPLALRYFELALNENTAIDFLPGIARSHNSLGRVYAAAGQPQEAIGHYQTALRIARLADSGDLAMQAHVNLGVLALSGDDIALALRHFQDAEELISSGTAGESPVLHHGQGSVLARQQQFAQALERFERARVMNEDREDWIELASNHYMIASIHSRQGDFETARHHAEQALVFDRRAEHSPGIAADLGALGLISERMGDDEMALEYLLRSLRVYLTLNQPRPVLETLTRLEDLAERTGRNDEAAQFRAQRERVEAALRR